MFNKYKYKPCQCVCHASERISAEGSSYIVSGCRCDCADDLTPKLIDAYAKISRLEIVIKKLNAENENLKKDKELLERMSLFKVPKYYDELLKENQQLKAQLQEAKLEKKSLLKAETIVKTWHDYINDLFYEKKQSQSERTYSCDTCQDTKKVKNVAETMRRIILYGHAKVEGIPGTFDYDPPAAYEDCPDCCKPERKPYKRPICSACNGTDII